MVFAYYNLYLGVIKTPLGRGNEGAGAGAAPRNGLSPMSRRMQTLGLAVFLRDGIYDHLPRSLFGN